MSKQDTRTGVRIDGVPYRGSAAAHDVDVSPLYTLLLRRIPRFHMKRVFIASLQVLVGFLLTPVMYVLAVGLYLVVSALLVRSIPGWTPRDAMNLAVGIALVCSLSLYGVSYYYLRRRVARRFRPRVEDLEAALLRYYEEVIEEHQGYLMEFQSEIEQRLFLIVDGDGPRSKLWPSERFNELFRRLIDAAMYFDADMTELRQVLTVWRHADPQMVGAMWHEVESCVDGMDFRMQLISECVIRVRTVLTSGATDLTEDKLQRAETYVSRLAGAKITRVHVEIAPDTQPAEQDGTPVASSKRKEGQG